MYTIKSFRYTQAEGWVAEVRQDNAQLDTSLPIRDAKLSECRNAAQAIITVACLPFEPDIYGLVVDVQAEAGAREPRIENGVSSAAWFEAQSEQPY